MLDPDAYFTKHTSNTPSTPSEHRPLPLSMVVGPVSLHGGCLLYRIVPVAQPVTSESASCRYVCYAPEEVPSEEALLGEEDGSAVVCSPPTWPGSE